ncbi:unnamed protein product, partial [Symbiodinium necroappetens]
STPSNLAASRLRRAADRLADSAGSSLRGSEAAPSEAPAQKAEVPVPLPVERTPRSKLTQSLAKRRRSSNMSSPRRSPQSAVSEDSVLLPTTSSKLGTAAEAQIAGAEEPLLRQENAPQSLHV